MLGDITAADEIYIVTGRTDMRKSIDGLCAIVAEGCKSWLRCHMICMRKETRVMRFFWKKQLIRK